jgi:hypothetical protein
MHNFLRVSVSLSVCCLFLMLHVSKTKAQTIADQQSITAEITANTDSPGKHFEKTKLTDAERIAALEEALRIQHVQLEQLRASLYEQSRVLNELRALAKVSLTSGGTPAVVTEPTENDPSRRITSTAGVEGDSQASDRLAAVELQAKKNSEALSKQLGSISFSGDLRLRFESIFGQSNSLANAANPAVFGNELTARFRPRIRLRLNLRGKINDEFDWGMRLATGSYADSITTNQTLTDFFNRKPFSLDQAYVNYKPKTVPGLRIQGGRFESPWTFTEMTFDSDLQ